VALSTFVLRGRHGEVEGAGVVFRDLSTEDALHRAQQEAERLGFIRAISAGMAHEIRNPLTAIRTFAELAPYRLDDPEFRESFLRVALSEVTRLDELVSQFMTLARPASVAREPLDICRLADKVVEALSATAEAHEVRVATCQPQEPCVVSGDSPRLHQCLLNLMLNAVEATPPGGDVEVRIGTEGTDARDDVAVTVWNSGSYIPPDDQEHVFEPFFTTKVSGTGLGLAICHTIIDEHEGQIVVQSGVEEGTSFTITLPVPSPHEANAVTPS